MTASPYPYHIHSIAEVAESIYQGEEPWFALGNFLHDWWWYAVDARADIITEPPILGTTLEEKRWAAFCAATVEELCIRTGFPLPAWTSKLDYVLEQPWFYYPQPSQREWLLTTTPEPFKRHNVFVGRSVLDNKYELRQFESKLRWEVLSDEFLQKLARAKEDAGVAPE